MQKNQFSDKQIVAILQQAEKGDKTVAEVCRQHNVSETHFYSFRPAFPVIPIPMQNNSFWGMLFGL